VTSNVALQLTTALRIAPANAGAFIGALAASLSVSRENFLGREEWSRIQPSWARS